MAGIAEYLERVRRTLATGVLPVSDEIALRTHVVDFLIGTYRDLGRTDHLQDAVQHLETILRRLPRESQTRPKYLSQLSYVRMSEHITTGSREALDAAISCGQQSKNLALSLTLPSENPDVYFEILSNLGTALAHRFSLAQQPKDLDECIACARETHTHAPKTSQAYVGNLNNLASRLRQRYHFNHDEKDIQEAMQLLKELQSVTQPGDMVNTVALAQLGTITADRFEHSDMLEDLDEATGYFKSALDSLPAAHELRMPALQEMTSLHRTRYNKTSNETDLAAAIFYSEMLLSTIPPKHSARGRFVLNHLRDLRQSMHLEGHSLEDVQPKVEAAETLLASMPNQYPEKRQCLDLRAGLVLSQFLHSNDLHHLLKCVRHVRDTINHFNEESGKDGTSSPQLQTSWLWEMDRAITELISAPKDASMRIQAEKKLPLILEAFHTKDGTTALTLEQLYRAEGLRLQVLAKAATMGQTLLDEEITSEMEKITEAKAAESKRLQQRRPNLKPNDYTTELGHRSLAMKGKTIIFDLSGMMEHVLGVPIDKKMTPKEFVAAHLRAEHESLDAARAEGRHPNTRLCRMCRDHAKVLQLTAEGVQLTSKKVYLPFGNYLQLSQRKGCSICQLILATITTDTGVLHPRFAAMDHEVQGTSLKPSTLSTGEHIQKFTYGLEHVSELRVVTPQNARHALRQGWELENAAAGVQTLVESQTSPIQDRSKQQVDLGMIRKWISDCDHNHGLTCNRPRSGPKRADEIPITLIDIVDQCLVHASSDAKYFALSYVWGQVKMWDTLRSNHAQRLIPGSLAEVHFPKTIRDAMAVVHSLGERYLWVDAICLVQDDGEQMARDIPNMDIIYGHAFATVVALDGHDAAAGLPGVSPGTREPQKITSLTVSDNSPHLDDDPASENRVPIYLTATPRPLYLALELSRWNSRGWVMQEQLLSRRCLYFSTECVYFQCARHTMSEGGVNQDITGSRTPGETSITDDDDFLERANSVNPLLDLQAIAVHDLPTHRRLSLSFNAYTKLVSTYSQRNLTVKSDILNGLAGMISVMGGYFGSSTFHGLPAALISHALMWSPVARNPRRGKQLMTQFSLDPTDPDSRFPSWSWAGWDGPVDYAMFERVEGDFVLPNPSIKAYQTCNGAISDTIQSAKETPRQSHLVEEENEAHKTQDTEGKQVLAKLIPDPVRGSTWMIGAAQPPSPRNDPHIADKMLKFAARTVTLPVFRVSHQKEYLSLQSNVHTRSSQAVRRILDREGRHCGLWWEQAGYGYVGLGMSPEAERNIELVEVSTYGDAYDERRGPYLVEGPISMFDNQTFPATGLGSSLVNVLAVDFDMGLPEGIGERCSIAVIHSVAWEAANPREREIQLV